jgi:hypothetical protein
MSLLSSGAVADEKTVETIVFLRHGEKPDKGLGQLDCRGLNRALALPRVIAKTFGKPDVIFAPNPSVPKNDFGEAYDYVRPLATIEPAAIGFEMPVEAGIGFNDVSGLRAALEEERRHDGRVVVAWEHKIIVAIVRDLLAAHGGDPSTVTSWSDEDYDRMDVVTIARTAKGETATYARMSEGLDGQSDTCPR